MGSIWFRQLELEESRLESVKVEPDAKDQLIWGESTHGQYSVKIGYINAYKTDRTVDVWTWKSMWKIKIPVNPLLLAFGWTAILERCLTHDNLNRRGFYLRSRCYMCQKDAEDIPHLLLHCEVARELWSGLLSIFWVHWMPPYNIRDAYAIRGLWRVRNLL